MPELESCRFNGTVADSSGRVLGEARMWGQGQRGAEASWSGWLRVADLGEQLAPGRYTVTAFAGWSGEFEVVPGRPSRVFETDLLPVAGVGPPPWPAPDQDEERDEPRRPPLTGTPWQGAQGIPPYKQQGDRPPRRP